MPDEERSQVKNINDMAVKLAFLLGVTNWSSDNEVLHDLPSIISSLTTFLESTQSMVK